MLSNGIRTVPLGCCEIEFFCFPLFFHSSALFTTFYVDSTNKSHLKELVFNFLIFVNCHNPLCASGAMKLFVIVKYKCSRSDLHIRKKWAKLWWQRWKSRIKIHTNLGSQSIAVYTNPTMLSLWCPRQKKCGVLKLGVHILSFVGCIEITYNTSY